MTDTTTPTETPNVVISNPDVRKVVNLGLGVAGVAVTLATIVDLAISDFDISGYTGPAAAIILGIGALFGLSVTVPNIPRK